MSGARSLTSSNTLTYYRNGLLLTVICVLTPLFGNMLELLEGVMK
jgi:hypothetical protein